MGVHRFRSSWAAAVVITVVVGWAVAQHPLVQADESKSAETKAAEAMFRQIDASGDGIATMDEATLGTRSFLERVFKEAGKKPTERLSRGEFVAAYERLKGKSATPKPASGSTATPARSTDSISTEGIQFIDSDANGSITRAEWSKFTQTFSSLDVDKSNAVDSTELEATGGVAKTLSELGDLDGDGKIARVEWGKMVQRFTRLDTNKDGALDESELKTAAAAAVSAATGLASLPSSSGKSAAKSGPTLWRGRIERRGEIELVINGSQIVGREIGGEGQSLGAGTFTMTGDGKSGNMDATYTEGNKAGEVCLGIYKLEGDTLTWCVNNRGGRPQSFSGGQGNWMLTLTRVDMGK